MQGGGTRPPQVHRLVHTGDGMGYHSRAHPCDVVISQPPLFDWQDWTEASITALRGIGLDRLDHGAGSEVAHRVGIALAVGGDDAINVDQMNQTFVRPRGDSTDDHASVAVANEHEVTQILGLEGGDDVNNMAFQARCAKVGSVAQTRQGDRVGLVALGSQAPAHPLPRPATKPATRNEHVGRHQARVPNHAE